MPLKPTYVIPNLPPAGVVETAAILREVANAHRRLAEVKGSAGIIPNQGILIDTLSLQEARASSEIENIITTQDEMFQAMLFPEGPDHGAAKEVALYNDALKCGWELMLKQKGLLTKNTIVRMFQILKGTDSGFRKTPGTQLKNDTTGQTVYVPPQDHNVIDAQMLLLERFINDDTLSNLDPLVKMAVIHHQFESIHPFPDGNGRIGRIVNVLYLTRVDLLDIPILYLSRYINKNKGDYYRLLQAVRDDGAWEEWIVYMLRGIAETSEQTLELIRGVAALMADYKRRLRSETKIYSQDLINNLFRHPYTRIEFVQRDLDVSRPTASKYLDLLTEKGFVAAHQIGKNKYFVNQPLLELFLRVSEEEA
ncbi:MAG: Fic family protein [Verrucomicrobiaceae bacterium]|nr:MAG: Fic family protein [Verrucomicrobiaceae bacterium]